MTDPLNPPAQNLAAESGTSPHAREQWYLPLLLAATALLGLIPRIYFASLNRIDYDAFWDLFIATQDRWRFFLEEAKVGAHPPLFHLIMRVVYHLGHSHLTYRMPGILATIGTAFLIGLIVKRVCGNRVFAVLATLAATFAGTSIEMSYSMRSYPVAVFFVVLSFYYLLEALELPAGRAALESCITCSLALTLAILTEYFSVFYLAASAGLIVLRLTFDAGWRGRLAQWLRLRPILAIFSVTLPFGVTIWLLLVHFGAHPVASNYYWVPSQESLFGFLTRSLHLELTLLTPIKAGSPVAALIVLALFAIFAAAVRFLTRKEDANPFVTWAPVLILLMLLLEIAGSATASRYPFGGELRHQFILSPFLFISFFVLAAGISNFLRGSALRTGFAVAMLSVVALFSYRDWLTTPRVPEELFAKDYIEFRRALGHSDLVCLDMYSLVAYFGHTHDWKWKSEWRYDKAMQPFIVYRTVSPSGEQVRIMHDRILWNWDLSDPVTYMILAEELRLSGQPKMTLFYLAQIPDKISWPEREASVERLADQQGLKVEKAVPLRDGMGVVFSLK